MRGRSGRQFLKLDLAHGAIKIEKRDGGKKPRGEGEDGGGGAEEERSKGVDRRAKGRREEEHAEIRASIHPAAAPRLICSSARMRV